MGIFIKKLLLKRFVFVIGIKSVYDSDAVDKLLKTIIGHTK